jgi:tetratricopeptide (TPR) repeat protein
LQTLDRVENATFVGLLTRLGESLIPDTPVMNHVLTPTEGEQLWSRHETASRLRHDKAATRAERGELSLTRLNYLQAAQHFRSAASLVAEEDMNLKLAYLARSAYALMTHGDEKGDNAILAQAVGVYRDVLRETTRERMPLQWAMSQNKLGIALCTLGQRERYTGRLEEAVVAFREALKEYTRSRVPLDWARSQNNLGNALAITGARERDTGRLEEAVVAFREALKERTRERVPLDWAATQNNLGNVLLTLGERESGIGLLGEALSAYREALKEYTRERVPLDWAMTQNNLGNVLWLVGVREGRTGRLEEARGAIGLAWDVYREAGMDRYDTSFVIRLRSIEDLVASRRSASMEGN